MLKPQIGSCTTNLHTEPPSLVLTFEHLSRKLA